MRGTYVNSIEEAEQYLNFLHQLCDMGAAMRNVITQTLNSKDMYEKLGKGNKCELKIPV